MRRAIGAAWPAMTRLFGIRPWDVERMTYLEVDHYRSALENYATERRRAMSKQQAAAPRPRPRRRR